MSQVIVERPRRGSRRPNRNTALALDPSRVDDETYSDPAKPRYSDGKSLNENLAPLRRFLESNVGRPWTKVYAEIRQGLDCRKATGLHVLQHLHHMVAVDAWLEGKKIMACIGWLGTHEVSGLYVHPVSGLLRNVPAPSKIRRAKPLTEVRISASIVYRMMDDVWYCFEYAHHDKDEIAEVIRFHEDQPKRNREHGLTQPGDRCVIRYRDLPPGEARYIKSRRQCTRQEIAGIEKKSVA